MKDATPVSHFLSVTRRGKKNAAFDIKTLYRFT